jgi:hypothetical protein
MWVRVTSMHFDGPPTKWLQSVNHRICKATWNELCSWIHDMFGRDQHDSLIRQLFHIKQSGPVQEYIDKFCKLVDQLSAYEPSHSADSRYYITRFVDGLKPEIKSVIWVQRLTNLDTGCSLVLLQEDAEASRHREFRKPDFLFKPKVVALASPPLKKCKLMSSLSRKEVRTKWVQQMQIPRLQHCVLIAWQEVCVISVLRSGARVTNAALLSNFMQFKNCGSCWCLIRRRLSLVLN